VYKESDVKEAEVPDGVEAKGEGIQHNGVESDSGTEQQHDLQSL